MAYFTLTISTGNILIKINVLKDLLRILYLSFIRLQNFESSSSMIQTIKLSTKKKKEKNLKDFTA
jgi:hypothetical protein